MKRWIVAAGAALSMVSAQAQDARPVGVLARIGNFFPSTNQARNEGKNWYLFGLQVDLGKLPNGGAGGSSRYAISVDSYQKGDLSATPVLLNVVRSEDNVVLSAGVGGAFSREARLTESGIEKKSRVEFAYQLSLGYDLARYKVPGLIELRYLGNGYSTLNGFALCFGFKF